jgi:hypothetical protein
VISAEPRFLGIDKHYQHETREHEVQVYRVGARNVACVIQIRRKLAIAYWCCALLCSAAHRHFHTAKRQANEQRLSRPPSSPSTSQASVVPLQRECQGVWREIERSSRVMLLVSGDCYSALNARKQLLLDRLVTASSELQFLNLIFSKHPKSGDGWAHRYVPLLLQMSSMSLLLLFIIIIIILTIDATGAL